MEKWSENRCRDEKKEGQQSHSARHGTDFHSRLNLERLESRLEGQKLFAIDLVSFLSRLSEGIMFSQIKYISSLQTETSPPEDKDRQHKRIRVRLVGLYGLADTTVNHLPFSVLSSQSSFQAAKTGHRDAMTTTSQAQTIQPSQQTLAQSVQCQIHTKKSLGANKRGNQDKLMEKVEKP